MTAGIETLKVLRQDGIYHRLETKSSNLEQGITGAASEAGVDVRVSRVASLLTIFFTDNSPLDFETVSGADTAIFSRFFKQLLVQGIYWPPSQFEAAFISLAHRDDDIQCTIGAIEKALNSL
jgi:glutamate-1-semialdehyde 2,1-aminomutase